MVRIVKQYARADDPEIARQKEAAEEFDYRHYTRRKGGKTESIIVAPGAKDRQKVQSDLDGWSYLYSKLTP